MVMYLNVEIFRVLIYFTWSALNNYLITEQMVIYIYFQSFSQNSHGTLILFCISRLGIFEKLVKNFKGNFARQILWKFFFKYTILSVFHLFLVVKRNLCGAISFSNKVGRYVMVGTNLPYRIRSELWDECQADGISVYCSTMRSWPAGKLEIYRCSLILNCAYLSPLVLYSS